MRIFQERVVGAEDGIAVVIVGRAVKGIGAAFSDAIAVKTPCGQKSKAPDFAASSVSDRIAFAYRSSRNRTAHVPAGEKAGRGPPLPTGSPFSEVRFEDEILRNTGMFRAFCGNGRRTLSAVQTVWRSTQSRANFSPVKSPANRAQDGREKTLIASSRHSVFSGNRFRQAFRLRQPF